MLASLRGGALDLTELLRFPSAERAGPDGLRWDMAALRGQLRDGLRAAAQTGLPIASVGIDSWGLDFGLLDAGGHLLGDPFHYRDPRSQRGHAASPIPDTALADLTDAQVLPVNTLFQLIADLRARPALLARADRLLMMADLLAHWLTGVARNELTLTRTTGLHSWATGGWSREILDRAGIPARLFGDIVAPGTVLGPLRPDLAMDCGLGPVPVIAVASHDTASAVSALPLGPAEAFLIAGSWNLIGFEAERLPAGLRAAGFGVEGGAEGRGLITRSLDGFVLLRQLRDDLAARGQAMDFAGLSTQARAALTRGAAPALDTSDPALLGPDGFVAAARRQFQARGLTAPGDAGGLALALYLGLIDGIADAVRRLARLTGAPVRALRMGGGGAQDAFFCDLLAARLDMPVLAGPIEASATGNAVFQLIGLGQMPDLTAARGLIAGSDAIRSFRPDPSLRHLLGRGPE